MTSKAALYDDHYGQLASEAQLAVRRVTYDEDIGQASWLMAAEAQEFFLALRLGPERRALEVACGAGGVTCRMARATGASCVGVDINPHAVAAARQRARDEGLGPRLTFDVADAGRPLPFPDAAFDAVFCNDSINHFPGRGNVLRDWNRVLRPGGCLLYTDPIVMTGQLSNVEVQERSAIGYFLFTPPGCNEHLLTEAGFQVLEVRDVTEAVARVAHRWRGARDTHRADLARQEGEEAFEAVQRFLASAHQLAAERRLSRFMYLASRSPRERPV
jgi:ubiquinone/menaquinone biosynthesis C-methylase UbiE